jgi:hypothetical protein
MSDNVNDEQSNRKRIPHRPPPWMAIYWEMEMMDIVAMGDPADVGLYYSMMGLTWLRGDGQHPRRPETA